MAILSYGGNRQFAYCALLFQVLLCLFFGLFADYDSALSSSDNGVAYYYPMFQDVHVMIFIGFGFLMTFLHKFTFSSVGLNFFLAAVALQWTIFCVSFWHSALGDGFEHKISLTIKSLIAGDFGAGAILISFGALLGKTSPLQMLIIVIIELVFYSLNETIGAVHMQAVDMGGSMFVHTWGAYFGLACSWTLCGSPKSSKKPGSDNPKNSSVYTSDTFAMIGTVFLWMFWPSFNGALATGDSQHRVVINTVLALSSCCVTAFCASAILRPDGKFDMVDIQNATLAGGVAVGSSADLVIGPWGGICVGFFAAWVSVIGYVYISPWLEERLGLTDTCGVHNLHGMPGVMGGIGGAISASRATDKAYGTPIGSIFAAMDKSNENPRDAAGQARYQIGALAVTLVIALLGGAFTGALVGLADGPSEYFEDSEWWEVPEDPEEEDDGGGEMHAIEDGQA